MKIRHFTYMGVLYDMQLSDYPIKDTLPLSYLCVNICLLRSANNLLS